MKQSDRDYLANFVKRARSDHKMTQDQLCELSGLSQKASATSKMAVEIRVYCFRMRLSPLLSEFDQILATSNECNHEACLRKFPLCSDFLTFE